MAKENFYRIDFVNWSEDYECTIVRTIEDVMAYLSIAKDDLDTPNKEEDAPTSLTITGVKMSEWQYKNWVKKAEP